MYYVQLYMAVIHTKLLYSIIEVSDAVSYDINKSTRGKKKNISTMCSEAGRLLRKKHRAGGDDRNFKLGRGVLGI